jgi:hypothetical protein
MKPLSRFANFGGGIPMRSNGSPFHGNGGPIGGGNKPSRGSGGSM